MTNEEEVRASAPYFFLSYARMPPLTETGAYQNDGDQDVIEFYDDLCRHVRTFGLVQDGASAGYLDRSIGTAARWDKSVMEALATSRTFVALYKPAYFHSPWCGREWAAFEARQNLAREDGSVAYDAIIPVLWVGEAHLPARLPPAARAIQYEDAGQPGMYRTEGIYGLRVGRHEPEYSRTTLAIARTIVKIAQTTQIPHCDSSLFSKDANAFGADMARDEEV